MKNLYQDVLNWWMGLPWYWKVLGCVVLVGIALLWILSIFTGSSYDDLGAVDAHQAKKTDRRLKRLEDEDEEITKLINMKKKSIATKLNQAGSIDAKTLERREALVGAKSMEELDKLQEEWDL